MTLSVSLCLYVSLYVCLSVCISLSFHHIHLTSHHTPNIFHFSSVTILLPFCSHQCSLVSLTCIHYILCTIPCIGRTGTRLLWNDPRSVDTLQNCSVIPLIISISLMTIASGIFGREQFNDTSL